MEPDAGLEIFDGEIFVRGVGFAVRRGQAEQQGVRTEQIAEGLHDRDAAALAHEGGFLSEGRLERPPRRTTGFSNRGCRACHRVRG